MTAPLVKGWCPGAHKPMMSGDGLVVRIRPFASRITAEQAEALCELSERYGNGVLDLTSRANIQVRGVDPNDHHALLQGLDAHGLIDADPAIETRRNILMPPTWQQGNLTHRLYSAIIRALPDLPSLPQKFGFAIDTAETAHLTESSADVRFELDQEEQLLMRLDGAPGGFWIEEATAMETLREVLGWFLRKGGASVGRMSRLLTEVEAPPGWAVHPTRRQNTTSELGPQDAGTFLGAPFGKIAAQDQRALLRRADVGELRLLPNRRLFVPGAAIEQAKGFETRSSQLMNAQACPGAPFCPQATVATTELARDLAQRVSGTLHVSGCAKGCAFPRSADVTLVGRDGRFDLVSTGRPWDEPGQRGIRPAHVSDVLAGL